MAASFEALFGMGIGGYDDPLAKCPSNEAILIRTLPDDSEAHQVLTYLGIQRMVALKQNGTVMKNAVYLAPNPDKPGKYTEILSAIAEAETNAELPVGSYDKALQAALIDDAHNDALYPFSSS